MMTRVLVTGAKGQLGQTIKELYQENNDEIQFIFADRSTLDITNTSEIQSFFSNNKIDYCINCAAYTNVEQAESHSDEAFKINADAAKNLATTCQQNKTVLIHISTDYVFDGLKQAEYLESDSTNPLSEYGKSKWQGEQYISKLSDAHFIIRTSWLYSNYEKNFLKTILAKLAENVDLKITTEETGTPTSCIDLSRFIYFLIKSNTKAFGLYHFSNSGTATWYDFACEIAKNYRDKTTSKIEPVAHFKTLAKRPKYSVLSKQKVISTFNYSVPNWKNSIAEILN